MEVPSGCETWEDWINKGCTVNVYYGNGYWTCNLMKEDGYDYAYFGEGNEPIIKITEGGLKKIGYPESINLDDNIKDGGSYTLIVFNG